jgi:hypothetical protein
MLRAYFTAADAMNDEPHGWGKAGMKSDAKIAELILGHGARASQEDWKIGIICIGWCSLTSSNDCS